VIINSAHLYHADDLMEAGAIMMAFPENIEYAEAHGCKVKVYERFMED